MSSEDEPRDEQGRWTSGGGGASGQKDMVGRAKEKFTREQAKSLIAEVKDFHKSEGKALGPRIKEKLAAVQKDPTNEKAVQALTQLHATVVINHYSRGRYVG